MLFLFTGSFDPIHLGHLELIEELTRELKHNDKIIVSPIFNPFKETPLFNIHERCVLLQTALRNYFWQIPNILKQIVIDCDLSKFTTSFEQAEYVTKKYNTKPVLVFGPDYDEQKISAFYKIDTLRKQYEFKFIRYLPKNLNSTDIRNLIKHNDWNTLAKLYVSRLPNVFNLIRALKAFYDPATPKVAVDAIIYHEELEKYIVIERKYEPMGLAFVGGFVDYGETLVDAVKREIFEETGLKTTTYIKHIACLENTADNRHSVITNLFYVIVKGNPQAGDDAKNIVLLDLEELQKIKNSFVLGHSKLFDIFMEKYRPYL